MLVINKGKRVIDGISPMMTKDIEEARGKLLVDMYKGEIELLNTGNSCSKKEENKALREEVASLKEENNRLREEITSLKEEKEAPVQDELSQSSEEEILAELHRRYKEIYGKDVPNNKKNDLDWLESKLDTEEEMG